MTAILYDRSAFDESLQKGDPNNPIGGIMSIRSKQYKIIGYKEFSSSSFTENEFHEIERDYLAHVFVEYVKRV